MADTPEQARRALLQNALQAVEQLKGKLDAIEHARTEPIAIVGLGCRFPGGAVGPDAYWSRLEAGFDAVTGVPADRWSPDVYAEIDAEAAAKMPPPRAGFIDRIDEFDAQFFGIAPREAIWMDPQHRIVLEVAWEALEHAGIAPESLRGSRTGVFLGITAGDYALNAMEAAKSRLGVHIVSGITPNAAAGRIAYLLGLHGPCMAIDTACSSSLTAIHVACQSLRNRESQVAIAGKARSSATRARSAPTKGTMPRAITSMRMAATPCRTKRFIPTGGVIMPISASVTSSTPNQIGSRPSAPTSGYTAPSVSRIIDRLSIRQPRRMRMTRRMTSTAIGGRPELAIHSAIAWGTPPRDMKILSISAPSRIR